MDAIETYWKKFLQDKKLPDSTPFAGECSFGSNEQMSCNLTALVLTGHKQATTSALESFELDNETLPHKDFYYAVTDWSGNPCAIIKTTKVSIMAYKDMTWDLARKEGEDNSMESWIKSHNTFFQEDSDIMGYTFSPDMPIVFEEFELVYGAAK